MVGGFSDGCHGLHARKSRAALDQARAGKAEAPRTRTDGEERRHGRFALARVGRNTRVRYCALRGLTPALLGIVITEHLDNVPCKSVLDLSMPWHRLSNFGFRVLIPVMFAR